MPACENFWLSTLPRALPPSLMMVRLCCFLALLFALAVPASAQPTVVPVRNFVDVPVAAPSTPERVKSAIVRSALIAAWDVVEEADGSLLVSKTKVDDYAFRFKVRFTADKYSVTYVDSSGLRFNDGRLIDPNSPTYASAEARHVRRFQDDKESAYAVKSAAYIHPFYEESVRQLLAGVRRHLNAPI